MRLGEVVGRKLKGGEVIELISDLGGGKTAFVRGLARGMGAKEPVASPSFTISRIYRAGKLELHHYDFYRLSDAGIMADELAESIANPSAVVAVEWPSAVTAVLPSKRLSVNISVTGDTMRRFEFNAAPNYRHLIEGLA